MKKLYKKYAGKEITNSNNGSTIFKGIVCGYNSTSLIIAVTEYISGKYKEGWPNREYNFIITNTNNELGYWYVPKFDLSKLK